MQFGADNDPSDALSHCRVVFSHSQASRSLSKLSSLQMQIVSFRQLHDLLPWQRLHGTPGEDVRLDPQHLHLPLSSLHGDLAPDLVGPLPSSADYRYILSASAATQLSVITCTNGMVVRSSPASWPPPNTRTGPRQLQDVLVPPSFVTRGGVL